MGRFSARDVLDRHEPSSLPPDLKHKTADEQKQDLARSTGSAEKKFDKEEASLLRPLAGRCSFGGCGKVNRPSGTTSRRRSYV